VYNGELIKFIAGTAAAQVVISEVAAAYVYSDASSHIAEYTKTATCGVVGNFPFTDLVPLISLQNVWKKDDLRHCVKDAAYEAANFDANGFGVTAAEKGWRIFSKAYSTAAGTVLVTKKDFDADFNTVTATGGVKDFVVTKNNIQQFNVELAASSTTAGTPNPVVGDRGDDGNLNIPIGVANPTPISKMQPYFVVLTLIKL
jgi:hypothetical protein